MKGFTFLMDENTNKTHMYLLELTNDKKNVPIQYSVGHMGNQGGYYTRIIGYIFTSLTYVDPDLMLRRSK